MPNFRTPHRPGGYDEVTDRYTTDFAGEAVAGLIVCIVGEAQRCVVILHVTAVMSPRQNASNARLRAALVLAMPSPTRRDLAPIGARHAKPAGAVVVNHAHYDSSTQQSSIRPTN